MPGAGQEAGHGTDESDTILVLMGAPSDRDTTQSPFVMLGVRAPVSPGSGL
jgi:hypothetical protein